MPKRSPIPRLVEQGGDRYPTLEEAQAAALDQVAQAIASLVRKRLDQGTLRIVEGRVLPAEGQCGESGEQKKECNND